MKPISYLAAIRLTGADTLTFLHRQLSADIEGLTDATSTFACLCQPKGRVIALLAVQATPDGALLLCASSLAKTVATRLGMFVFRDDVRVEAAQEFSVCAPAPDASVDATMEPLPGLRYALAPQADVLAPDAAIESAFKAAELERGVAWLDETSSEKFLPQMLGYESIGALDFRKGCFPGQEIIARTRYLGKLKQRALVVSADQALPFAPLTKAMLEGGDHRASAVFVDTAPDGDGARALLVARSMDAFEVTGMMVEDQPLPVSGRWLQAGPVAAGPQTEPA